MPALPSVSLRSLSFTWPDGDVVLDAVTGTFSTGRTGLVGANGSGKSTLLRLISGQLSPTSGEIVRSGSVDHLTQGVTRHADATVAELLGIATIRRSLRAVESGSVDPAHFDAIGTDWDIEERAVAELSALALPTDLDRSTTALSGGEVMLVAITGIHLRGADIALLDEPTNNLDGTSRERLYGLVGSWRGTLLVVSHDLDLLDLMDQTAELRNSGLTTFGGPYGEFRAWQEAQQEAARQALRTAEQVLRLRKRERIKAEERIAHSERQGRKDTANRKYVPAAIDARRNSAEKAQGARRGAADARVAEAREAVAAADLGVREDDTIRVDLPDPAVHRGQRIATLPNAGGADIVVRGPERVALVGDNGVGKTTLVERLLPTVHVRVGYLPQRIVLDECGTVLDSIRSAAPAVPLAELRNRLARLLIRGTMVDRPVGSLSGGERFRVALARLLLADPPPELLVLDEPTNDLDIASVDQLVAALSAYRGALLVVSHDRRFLARLGIDVTLRMSADGGLTPVEAVVG